MNEFERVLFVRLFITRTFLTANEAETTASTITKEQLGQRLALLKPSSSSSTASVSLAHKSNEINAFSYGLGIYAPWIIDSRGSNHDGLLRFVETILTLS